MAVVKWNVENELLKGGRGVRGNEMAGREHAMSVVIGMTVNLPGGASLAPLLGMGDGELLGGLVEARRVLRVPLSQVRSQRVLDFRGDHKRVQRVDNCKTQGTRSQ